MIHFKLAGHALTHHREQYGPFILASITLVAVNYIFWNTCFNTSLNKLALGQQTIYLMILGTVFVTLLTIFLMIYVNRFLIKQQVHELALYKMLGLATKDLNLILTIEVLFLLIVSLVGGLVSGLVFNKLFFLILCNLLQTKAIVEQFSQTGLLVVIVIFSLLFLWLLLSDFWQIRQLQPVVLWQQTNQVEVNPRSNGLLGGLGVLLLAVGYYLAVKTKPTVASLSQFLVAVVFVVLGTYLVFLVSSIWILNFLQQRPHFYYQPSHFIALSGLLYRMKQNALSLASICLLCSAILVSLVGSTGLYLGKEKLVNTYNPADLMLVQQHPFSHQQQQILHRAAKQNQINLRQSEQMQMTTPIPSVIQDGQLRPMTGGMHIIYQVSTISVSDYNRIQKTSLRLKKHQILVYSADNLALKHSLNFNQQSYQVKVIPQFKLGFSYQRSIYRPIFIITANQQVAHQINPKPWLYVQGQNIQGTQKHKLKFASQIPSLLKLDSDKYSAKVQMEQYMNSLVGSVLFVGGLISLSMIIVMALLIYYKQLSEGYADQKRFLIMQEVGLSKLETKKAIHSQILLLFMLPLIGAIINLLFALPAIKSVLVMLFVYSFKLLAIISLTLIVLVAAYYGIIYGITAKVYTDIVNCSNKKNETD